MKKSADLRMHAVIAAQNRDAPETARTLLRGTKPSHNAFEVTVERLGSAIKMGLYGPGDQLPSERELGEMMGVSRTVIREAIRVLSVQGVLIARRGRTGGTFVSSTLVPRNVKELHVQLKSRGTTLLEILDHRLVVEMGVAELAAQRATSAQRDKLTEIIENMKDAERHFPTYRRLDTQMHLLIAAATGNQRLSSVLADIQVDLADLMSMVPYSPEACAHSTVQHKQIVESIIAKKPARAREAMREHVLATTSFLSGLLQ